MIETFSHTKMCNLAAKRFEGHPPSVLNREAHYDGHLPVVHLTLVYVALFVRVLTSRLRLRVHSAQILPDKSRMIRMMRITPIPPLG